MPESAVVRTAYRTQVKEVLLQRILDGTYLPGERIIETRVARELGVSPGPVREALRELESLRLVASEPFVGVRVREVSPEVVGEVYPIRSGLEEVAARTAVARLNGDVSALAAELREMRRVAALGDPQGLMKHDVQFHRLIVESSGNQALLEIWTSLQIEMRSMITLFHHTDLPQIAESHVPILDAISRRDADATAAALREHFEFYGQRVVESLRREAGTTADR